VRTDTPTLSTGYRENVSFPFKITSHAIFSIFTVQGPASALGLFVIAVDVLITVLISPIFKEPPVLHPLSL